MNKRAQEVNITTIIVVILAILVLVIVAAAFTGGMKSSIDKIKGFFGVYSATDEEAARQLCDTWCSTERYTAWCNEEFTVGADKVKKTCKQVLSTCSSAVC